MNYYLKVDLTARVGEIAVGNHSLWLPKAPGEVNVVAVQEFPLEVPAWRIKAKHLFRITVTLLLRGTITLYQRL